RTKRGVGAVRADWYVCALPLERARPLLNRRMRDTDPHLSLLSHLGTGFGNGIKFFLREPTPIAKGIVIYSDAPWVIGSTSQAQFWPLDFAATYGDGRARDALSVVWVGWDTPGIVFGKTARHCTPTEIARELWEQMKQHFEPGDQPLTDDL